MKIYIVTFHDYDGYDIVGYFTDYEKAQSCCDYLNRTRPSPYDHFEWVITEYSLDETDYAALNMELDERERAEYENRVEKIRQVELAELARLKAKYE